MFDNKIGECYIHSIRSINLITVRSGYLLWGTLKNTEAEEKWVRKREELVKKIKENNKINGIFFFYKKDKDIFNSSNSFSYIGFRHMSFYVQKYWQHKSISELCKLER